MFFHKSSESPCATCTLGYILICLGESGTYGAAASDISPNISGGTCSGSIDPSQCNGQSPVAGWTPPSCPTSKCGTCYTVTHTGSVGSAIGRVGNTITVQIIDACPSTSPANYCKTDMPSTQRCGDSGTNQLDIDTSAYMALTGQAFGNVRSQNCLYSLENKLQEADRLLLGTHAEHSYLAILLPRGTWLLSFGIYKWGLHGSDSGRACVGLFFWFERKCGCRREGR